jgi:hypothetical protein
LVSPLWQRARSHINRRVDYSWLPKTLQWLPPPPYLPDLAPCDFFIFPRIKLRLKGRCFDTTEEIHAESQEAIDIRIFENFQGCTK